MHKTQSSQLQHLKLVAVPEGRNFCPFCSGYLSQHRHHATVGGALSVLLLLVVSAIALSRQAFSVAGEILCPRSDFKAVAVFCLGPGLVLTSDGLSDADLFVYKEALW